MQHGSAGDDVTQTVWTQDGLPVNAADFAEVSMEPNERNFTAGGVRTSMLSIANCFKDEHQRTIYGFFLMCPMSMLLILR